MRRGRGEDKNGRDPLFGVGGIGEGEVDEAVFLRGRLEGGRVGDGRARDELEKGRAGGGGGRGGRAEGNAGERGGQTDQQGETAVHDGRRTARSGVRDKQKGAPNGVGAPEETRRRRRISCG